MTFSSLSASSYSELCNDHKGPAEQRHTTAEPSSIGKRDLNKTGTGDISIHDTYARKSSSHTDILCCDNPLLQHELHRWHRVGVDPRLLHLDTSTPALIPNINETVSGLDNDIPSLALRILHLRRRPSAVETNEAFRMPKHTPVVALLPCQ